jgi:peptide/nickel transport system substrate-binding protein
MQFGPTRSLTRRELVRGGLFLVGMPMAALLAQACGGSGQAPPNPPTAAAPAATAAPTQAPARPAAAATTAPVQQPAATTQAAPGAPRRGGTLLVGKTTEAPSLEPHRENALSRARVTQNIYSYLVQADSDLKIVPDLAEKWDISPDGQTYTFTLRKGVKFHTGRELTAEDVKYSASSTRQRPRKAPAS